MVSEVAAVEKNEQFEVSVHLCATRAWQVLKAFLYPHVTLFSLVQAIPIDMCGVASSYRLLNQIVSVSCSTLIVAVERARVLKHVSRL